MTKISRGVSSQREGNLATLLKFGSS